MMLSQRQLVVFLVVLAASLLGSASPKSLSAAEINAIAQHRCRQVLTQSTSAVDETDRHREVLRCCEDHIRRNLPLVQCRGIGFSHAISIIFATSKDLHGEGNRRIADFVCCYTVYRGVTELGDERCFNLCRSAYYTAGLSREQFLNTVETCKASNPGYVCFKRCVDSHDGLSYNADECLMEQSPELADGIPLGEVAD